MTNVLCQLEVNNSQEIGKRKRASEGGSEKRQRVELDVKDVIGGGGVKVVVIMAGWKKEASEKALEMVTGVKDVKKTVYWADKDDVSSEISYELGVLKVPAVIVLENGKKLKEITDFSSLNEAKEDLMATLTPDPIPSVTSEAHFNTLKSSSTYTIFDFYAAWCAPCMRIKPHLPSIQEAFPNTTLFKIDRDAHLPIHEACGVQKIPTFQIYKDGQLVDSFQHSNVGLVKDFIEKNVSELSFDADF